MKLDCYAVLGLSPTAEDVVIRAAYLALMRSYHPDKNASAEAAARARAITEAYKMIGDPARRAQYGASRWEHQFEILGYDAEAEPPRRLWPKVPVIQWPKMPVIQWPKAPVTGAVAASALVIVLAVMVLPLTQKGSTDTARPSATETPSVKSVATEDLAATPSRTSEERPSELTPEISSRLAETSPPSALTTPSQPEKALASSFEQARAIPKPETVEADAPPRPQRTAEASLPPPGGRAAPAKAAPIDEKARVEALEQMSTSFYNQSVNHADDAKRSRLQQARAAFVTSRDACRSDKCIGDAHANYIREIGLITQKPKQTDP